MTAFLVSELSLYAFVRGSFLRNRHIVMSKAQARRKQPAPGHSQGPRRALGRQLFTTQKHRINFIPALQIHAVVAALMMPHRSCRVIVFSQS